MLLIMRIKFTSSAAGYPVGLENLESGKAFSGQGKSESCKQISIGHLGHFLLDFSFFLQNWNVCVCMHV